MNRGTISPTINQDDESGDDHDKILNIINEFVPIIPENENDTSNHNGSYTGQSSQVWDANFDPLKVGILG